MDQKINEKITQKRENLGMSDTFVSSKIGITIDEYFDIEAYPDEIFTVTSLREVKSLLNLLSLDFFELSEIQCAFCAQKKPFLEEYFLPRNELIKKKRLGKGMSPEELGDILGFYEITITNMEKDANFLEEWVIENIANLANELDIPIQILLGVKCKRCSR
jgi:DNA-binding XRE family transcriptional regulator